MLREEREGQEIQYPRDPSPALSSGKSGARQEIIKMPQNKIKVLDNGYIALVDSMGMDKAVIEAARRCYMSEPQGEESDAKLVRHLISKDHGTPFEHAYFRFAVKCPPFVAR